MSFHEHKDTSGNLEGYHIFITFPTKGFSQSDKAVIIRINTNKNYLWHHTINNILKYAHLRDGHYVYNSHIHINEFYVYPDIPGTETLNIGTITFSKFTINFIDNTNYNNIQLFTGDSVSNMFILMNGFDVRNQS